MKYFTNGTAVILGLVFLFLLGIDGTKTVSAQDHSVARMWNEAHLNSIRHSRARPPMHARNLFHASIAMYDAWAIYDPIAEPWLIGNTVGTYTSPFEGVIIPENSVELKAAQEEAISYAMYRFIKQRFANEPGTYTHIYPYIDSLMISLGYDPSFTSTAYLGGTPAQLGNYIATQLQSFGLVDGSNMANDHINQYYDEINPDLFTENPGNPTLIDPNKWQPLTLEAFIDQNGNPLPNSPEAMGVEWGNVIPFSCTEEQKSITVDGDDTWVTYFDNNIGPPQIDVNNPAGMDSFFKWGHMMVPIWQSHLDSNDGVYIDASPASMGNVPIESYPHTFEEYQAFYDLYNG